MIHTTVDVTSDSDAAGSSRGPHPSQSLLEQSRDFTFGILTLNPKAPETAGSSLMAALPYVEHLKRCNCLNDF